MIKYDIKKIALQSLEEIKSVFLALNQNNVDLICDELLKAKAIALYSCGREGLILKAFCMRMMHLGLNAHMVGDMTTPKLGKCDILIISTGPGNFSTGYALLNVAKKSNIRTMVITAQPSARIPQNADIVIHLPAQTMADDLKGTKSIFPMGSLFEIVELIFFDLISLIIRERTGQTFRQMRARHTNLE